MRLLVLGGTWFLGRTLAEQALGRGWQVTTFSRGSSGRAWMSREDPLQHERADEIGIGPGKEQQLMAAWGRWLQARG